MTGNNNEQLACAYAALLLHDDKITITEDKIAAACHAAGVEVQPFWPKLFAKVLANGKVDDLLTNICSAGPAPAACSAPAGAAAAAPAKEEKGGKKKEEKKVESEEEDMGMGLFD